MDPPPPGQTPDRRSNSDSRGRSSNNSRIRSPGSESDSTDGEYHSETEDCLTERLGICASLNVLTEQTDNQLLQQKLEAAEAALADKTKTIEDNNAQIEKLLHRISESESDLKRAIDFYTKPWAILDRIQLSPNGKAALQDPAVAGSPQLVFNARLWARIPSRYYIDSDYQISTISSV